MKQKTTAIKLKQISKLFHSYYEKPTLVENILGLKQRRNYLALDQISLEIQRGESVGIIGKNGSGKTTLLEIIAKITAPTRGLVATYGKVASLIDLESGFHQDLTGYDNIGLYGLLIGMTKNDIAVQLDSIINYSGIEDFIYSPLYSYSEGMKLRLGFSIILHSGADIFLLDENLFVGDESFILKSTHSISKLMKKGKTFVIVSHVLEYILRYCSRTIWIDNGKIVKDGNSKLTIKEYRKVQRQSNSEL